MSKCGGIFMKQIRFIGTGVLLLFLGSIVPTYALQEQHEQEAKPEKQEQQAKPEKQEQQKAPQQAKGQGQQQKPETQAKPEKPQPQKAPEQAKGQEQQQKPEQQAKPEKQKQNQAQQAKPEKPQQQKATQQAKLAPQQESQPSRANGGTSGGGAHGRISDDHYRASFGDSHRFHVNEGDYRNRRFQYGGYSFGFVDPWPEGWLYTDDVYIVYTDDGYYMYDSFHPGIRIAVNIF
jgi:cytoskeletal protein RodZ